MTACWTRPFNAKPVDLGMPPWFRDATLLQQIVDVLVRLNDRESMITLLARSYSRDLISQDQFAVLLDQVDELQRRASAVEYAELMSASAASAYRQGAHDLAKTLARRAMALVEDARQEFDLHRDDEVLP